jgi:hypothetical protein
MSQRDRIRPFLACHAFWTRSGLHVSEGIILALKKVRSCNGFMTAEGSSFRRRVFVLMPFGKKDVPRKPRIDLPPEAKEEDETLQVDFDAVYERLFRPLLEAAGLQPLRADDERSSAPETAKVAIAPDANQQ